MLGKFSVTATINLPSVNLEDAEEGKLRDTESDAVIDLTSSLVQERIKPLFDQGHECWPDHGNGHKLGTGTRPDDETRGIIYASYLTEENAQRIKDKLEKETSLNGMQIWDVVISNNSEAA